jgi:hypothetical protein
LRILVEKRNYSTVKLSHLAKKIRTPRHQLNPDKFLEEIDRKTPKQKVNKKP